MSTSIPPSCNGCGSPLLLQNLYCDDGCPCNMPRGINFEPLPCEICRSSVCVKPGHRLDSLFKPRSETTASPGTSILDLRSASQIDPETTLSISLTVSSPVGPYMLDELARHADEIVVVLAVQDPAIRSLWLSRCRSPGNSIPIAVLPVSPLTHPELYVDDLPETYLAGPSLCGEIFDPPTLDKKIPRDWSAIRNLGWTTCTMKWRIALRSSESLLYPEHLRSICQRLGDLDADLALLPHSRGPRRYAVARLARNFPEISFSGAAREILAGGQRPAFVEHSLATDESRWTPESEPPEELQDRKTLYADGRQNEWIVPHSSLIQLARVSHLDMPDFAKTLLELGLGSTMPPAERSWAHALMGVIYERRGDPKQAESWYRSSLEVYPNWKTSMRLCSLLFDRQDWSGCLRAYAQARPDVPLEYDDGAQNLETSLIHVASSLHILGKRSAARQAGQTILRLMPDSPAVTAFCRSLA